MKRKNGKWFVIKVVRIKIGKELDKEIPCIDGNH